jgi:hypothetical protein
MPARETSQRNALFHRPPTTEAKKPARLFSRSESTLSRPLTVRKIIVNTDRSSGSSRYRSEESSGDHDPIVAPPKWP